MQDHVGEELQDTKEQVLVLGHIELAIMDYGSRVHHHADGHQGECVPNRKIYSLVVDK